MAIERNEFKCPAGFSPFFLPNRRAKTNLNVKYMNSQNVCGSHMAEFVR